MIDGISRVWLPVSEMDAAVAFYRDKLGLEVEEHDGDWAEVTAGGERIGLNASESPSGSGGAVIAFSVDDLDGTVEQLKGNGVEFSGDVSEHPWGRIAPFKDADGNDLQVYEPSS
jgi:predicted enzyme related to lactoylglutathione lyase